MNDFSYIESCIISPIRQSFKTLGIDVEVRQLKKNIVTKKTIIDLKDKYWILVNDDLSTMGSSEKTLLIDSANNTFVSSPAEYQSMGLYKYQIFTDYIDIVAMNVTKPNEDAIMPFQLYFLELIPQKINR